MRNTTSRSLSWLWALAFMGLVGCNDSGHSLGDTRDLDAGKSDTAAASGGSGGESSLTQAGASGHSGLPSSNPPASSAGNGGGGSGASSPGSGGSGGNSGGQGGASTAKDAGANSDTPGGCGLRDDPCTSRPCCSPFVCTNLGGPMTCHESMRPPPDAALSLDTSVSGDTKCPKCPPMKCAYGSPVGSDGCTICACNPPPDGGADTEPRCPPGGCIDADLSTPCPSEIPVRGSACVGQTVCNYEDCPGTGHTQAMCRSDKWVLANGACDSVICLGAGVGNTCPVNKVCLLHVGGNPQFECIDNPCGSGLVSADCSAVTAGCTPLLSSSSGLTFYCST